MKQVFLSIAFTALASTALGASEYFIVNSTKVDAKVDALIAKVKNPQSVVYKCTEQEVSNKGTLRNK